MRWGRTFRAAVISTAFSLATSSAIALVTPVEARAEAPVPAQAGAIERLVDSYKAKGLTDAAVLVAREGVPILREAYGLANREGGIGNTPDAEFRIGSITKQFTALAILQLAEDRKLSLEDPITRFIPDAPPTWRKISVRHLLTHTSGIPNHTSLPDWVGQPQANRSPEDLVRFLRDRPLDFAPGSSFQYDNAGYVILGLIVQKASGQSLGDYLATHVFTRLGMQDTGFVSETALPRQATGYVHDGAGWRDAGWIAGVRSGIRESGAGGLYSTADDLLKWDQALSDPKRLGLADLKPMFTDYGHGYGFGYVVSTQDGHPVRWHNGHVDGFSAIIARYPEDKLTIIVLSNDDGAPVEHFSQDLAALYLKSPGR